MSKNMTTTSIPVTTSLQAEVATITPVLAEQYLAKNTHNRGTKLTNLKKVARALENGEWKLNGEAIKIATDGTILDGQHRLLAIASTGIPMTTLIIRGLAKESQETMDGGSPRAANDVLKLRGEPNSVILAAVAKKIAAYNAYGLKPAINNHGIVTTAEITSVVDSTPGIRELAMRAKKVASMSGLTGSLAGLLIHVFEAINPDDAEFFFDRLTTGEMLGQGDPIYELRRSLSQLKSQIGEKPQTYIAAICIKAWNKYRDGEDVKLLKFTSGGANPEQFPEPK